LIAIIFNAAALGLDALQLAFHLWLNRAKCPKYWPLGGVAVAVQRAGATLGLQRGGG